jgi:tRNA-dihydrouridine synthase
VNAVDFAKRMQAAGASAVAVHGRTRGQFYKGRADWMTIAQVKDAVSVPVIGSGDIFAAADVVAMIEQTGVDGVMVARGAQGNPWIFREANALLAGEAPLPRPTPLERVAMAREHMRGLVEFGGARAVIRMRKHVAWYVSEMPGATSVRTRVNETCTFDELDSLLSEYAQFLSGRRGEGRSE